MVAPDSKLKKGSDASYESKQQRDLILFTDKCLGLNVVPGALRAQGYVVQLKTDHFDQDTVDSDWLENVGQRGWVVLTKDKSFTHNLLEIVALLKANTFSFILTSGSFTGATMAEAFVAALPEIEGIISTKKPPLLAAVSKSGSVRITHTYKDLLDCLENAQFKARQAP